MADRLTESLMGFLGITSEINEVHSALGSAAAEIIRLRQQLVEIQAQNLAIVQAARDQEAAVALAERVRLAEDRERARLEAERLERGVAAEAERVRLAVELHGLQGEITAISTLEALSQWQKEHAAILTAGQPHAAQLPLDIAMRRGVLEKVARLAAIEAAAAAQTRFDAHHFNDEANPVTRRANIVAAINGVGTLGLTNADEEAHYTQLLNAARDAAIQAAAQSVTDQQTATAAITALLLPVALDQARLTAIDAAISDLNNQGRNAQAEGFYRAALDHLRPATATAVEAARQEAERVCLEREAQMRRDAEAAAQLQHEADERDRQEKVSRAAAEAQRQTALQRARKKY